MTPGLVYVAGEAALLLVLALVAGVLLGRFAWPRRRPDPVPRPPVRAGEAFGSARVAPASGDVAPASGDTGAAVADRRALDEAERRLWTCRAEVTELRAELTELSDRKDLEMARLETAAIEALETTITAHRERITVLEKEVAAGRRLLDDARAGADAHQSRAEQLALALAERDGRIAELTAE
ncbi:MAG: hypothetical protein ACFCVG_15345 [Kineosporiaceae bacterium]